MPQVVIKVIAVHREIKTVNTAQPVLVLLKLVRVHHDVMPGLYIQPSLCVICQ